MVKFVCKDTYKFRNSNVPLPMKKFSLIFCILLLCLTAFGKEYTPWEIPDPHASSLNNYVANPDNILSESAVEQINHLSAGLDRRAEVEMAVVAIDDMSSQASAADFAQSLFNAWGIGKSDKNTGVLILLVRNSRDIRIHTGGGMEGVLPDGVCSDIVQNTMIPLLRNGDWDGGMLAGVNVVVEKLTTDSALQELLLPPVSEPSPWGLYLSYYLSFSCLVLILLSFAAYRELNGHRNLQKNIRYRHARTTLYIYKVCAVFFPLPNFFFLKWYKRQVEKIRTTPLLCPECKHTMRRLSESEEDTYLNGAEQAEERVKSIDYDVWLCPSCYNHVILPYEMENTRYMRCPDCHAKTYGLVSDVIVKEPTALSEGRGEKTYLCKHCGKIVVKPYPIPRTPVVVAPVGGGRGSSGGFSGGGFGGGISFGGGAGGKF